MRVPLLVIGGGLSGIGAAIRAARFIPDVLLVEQHSRLGGLNSYFYRNGVLFETGLHAITNFAPPGDKRAPFNRLLRQLKLKRESFSPCPQKQSKVIFPQGVSLHFSNDFELFETSILSAFPQVADKLQALLSFLQNFDPFLLAPFRSARDFLLQTLGEPLLVDMILCPLMYYGSSHANDMDLGQFAIMFRAIYLEGMFRPLGSIKDFLDILMSHYKSLGGNYRLRCPVQKIICDGNTAHRVILENGEEIECDAILSTIGHHETLALLGKTEMVASDRQLRLGFLENIYRLPSDKLPAGNEDTTIIFFNRAKQFEYKNPDQKVDLHSGVICFPSHFNGLPSTEFTEIRTTHLANYHHWKQLADNKNRYRAAKKDVCQSSLCNAEEIIGGFSSHIVYDNTFTPVTIERYTAKIGGAIYGSPNKIKDGDIGLNNLFLAGTDQGFLGIIGSLLSGVSITNQHILTKL